jgi:hypothetical protein
MGLAAGRQQVSGERSGSDDEQVSRIKGVDAARQFVEEQFGYEAAPTDEPFGQGLVERLFLDDPAGEIDAEKISGVSIHGIGSLRRHRLRRSGGGPRF